MDKIYAKGMTKKEYFQDYEEQHREQRNAYRRKRYREKCRREIENDSNKYERIKKSNV